MSKVLCYLRSMPPLGDLTLKMLTFKLKIYFFLTKASRSHSLSLLTLEGMMQEDSYYVLYYSGFSKQCGKGRKNPKVLLKKYTPDRRLCLYYACKNICLAHESYADRKSIFLSVGLPG